MERGNLGAVCVHMLECTCQTDQMTTVTSTNKYNPQLDVFLWRLDCSKWGNGVLKTGIPIGWPYSVGLPGIVVAAVCTCPVLWLAPLARWLPCSYPWTFLNLVT
jgi:hypothetical protein